MRAVEKGWLVRPAPAEGIDIRRRCVSRPNEHQAIVLQRLGLELPGALETTEM